MSSIDRLHLNIARLRVYEPIDVRTRSRLDVVAAKLRRHFVINELKRTIRFDSDTIYTKMVDPRPRLISQFFGGVGGYAFDVRGRYKKTPNFRASEEIAMPKNFAATRDGCHVSSIAFNTEN